jgi:hypothetical protein
LLLVGGALSAGLEPFLDNVVLFWYPPHQHLVAFHAFGRTVPLFVPIGYAWFCGALLYAVARRFEHGVRPRDVWLMLLGIVVIDYIAIGLTSWLHIAGFYGHPPYNLGGYPLWWAAFDGTSVILGGALVYYLLPRLRGLERAWLVLIPTLMVGGTAGAVGGPITIALNSQWSSGAKWVAGALTMVLGCAIVHLVARVVPSHPATTSAAVIDRPVLVAS